MVALPDAENDAEKLSDTELLTLSDSKVKISEENAVAAEVRSLLAEVRKVKKRGDELRLPDANAGRPMGMRCLRFWSSQFKASQTDRKATKPTSKLHAGRLQPFVKG